jgi:Flp pilus assembly protein CpaB
VALASTRNLPATLAAPRLNLRLGVGLLIVCAAMLGLVAVYRGAQPHTVEVLRVARELQAGQPLQAEDLQVVAEALPDDVSSRLVPASERATLVGRKIAQPLHAGDLVTRPQVETTARVLAAGERLYALSVPAETVAGLRLQTGDQVEIVVTTNRSQPQQADTHVVLPRVAIFSVGLQEASPAFGVSSNNDRVSAGGGRSTTVVLRTDEAGYRALANARQTGDLDLAVVGAQEMTP